MDCLPEQPPSMLEAALELRRLGFSTIPLDAARNGDRNSGKRPALKRWKPYSESLPTETEIRRWWTDFPNFNLGIATGAVSRVAVIDLDSAEALERMRGILPETPLRVITAKGEHWYYRHCGRFRVGNRAKVGGLALDVRGSGGYVCCPPSLHWTGHRYSWVNEPTAEMLKELPTFDPSWIGEERTLAKSRIVVDPQEDRMRVIRRAMLYVDRMPPAISGQNGHTAMLRVVDKTLRSFRLSISEALPIILAYNDRCEPPFSEKELRHKIASVLQNMGDK